MIKRDGFNPSEPYEEQLAQIEVHPMLFNAVQSMNERGEYILFRWDTPAVLMAAQLKIQKQLPNCPDCNGKGCEECLYTGIG